MSKLMEQVKEIQRKAHVCPVCKGAWKVETYPFGRLMLCGECDGTGELPAPDIDKLVSVIEVLERYVEANFEMGTHECECAACEAGYRCYKGNLMWLDRAQACTKADVLVLNGLPGEEGSHV